MPEFDPALHPDWCSVRSATEPLAGTAAHERMWILFEKPGRWGRDVLDGEALGDELAKRLASHLNTCGARILFIRRPGREGAAVARPRLYACDTDPGMRRIHTRLVDSADDLLDIDLSASGDRDDWEPVAAPLALICSHGRRDQCCAARGRPVAAHLEGELGPRLRERHPAAGVWECSHTGGHRYAPVLLLPGSGYTYGSGDAADYVRAVDAELDGAVSLDGLRGRSTWPPLGQVAEVAVRESGVEAGIDDLTVDVAAALDANSATVGERRAVEVRHSDGRRWSVSAERTARPPLPASCGKGPVATELWLSPEVREL